MLWHIVFSIRGMSLLQQHGAKAHLRADLCPSAWAGGQKFHYGSNPKIPLQDAVAEGAGRAAKTLGVCQLSTARPKQNPIRSEAYRKIVASLPCANCGIEGYSQAAHPPPTGKCIKESDLECFPLCCTRPDFIGCHALFDQYKLMPKARMTEFAADCARGTRETIIAAGLWPFG